MAKCRLSLLECDAVMHRASKSFLGVTFTPFATLREAASSILRPMGKNDQAVVVHTCNVDHVVLVNRVHTFARLYSLADVVTLDSRPLQLLAKVIKRDLGARVAGADLIPEIAAQAEQRGLTLAIVGGSPDSCRIAARNLQVRYPALPDVLAFSPSLGFHLGGSEDRTIVESLQTADVIVVCLGAPKQEEWMSFHRHELPGKVLVGAGGTVDFLSGKKARAPRFMQMAGLEWVFRIAAERGQLWRRYVFQDAAIVPIIAAHLLGTAKTKSDGARQ